MNITSPVNQGSDRGGCGEPPTSEVDDTREPRRLVPVPEPRLLLILGGNSGAISLSLLCDDRRRCWAAWSKLHGRILVIRHLEIANSQ